MDDVAKKPSILGSEQSDADVESDGAGDEHHRAEPPAPADKVQNFEADVTGEKDLFHAYPLGRDIAGLEKFVHDDLGASNLRWHCRGGPHEDAIVKRTSIDLGTKEYIE